jgi:Type II secretion system (T2SS), protein E, N-terminal domain
VSQKALAGADTTETPVRVPLGQLLIQAGFLTQVQLDDALYEGSRTGERLGEVVVRRGLATEDDVARLLAEQWGLDYVERSSIWFDANALAQMSREDAQRLEALPTRVEDGRVVVAVAEPTEQRLGALRELLGEETVMIVVPKSALDAGLRSDLLRSRGQFGPSEELNVLESDATVENDAEGEGEEWDGDGGGGDGGGGDDGGDGGDDGGDDGDEPMAAVTKLPVKKGPVPKPSDDTTGDDAVAALADEANAIAERLAAQAAAVKAQQSEMKVRSAEYESQIQALEDSKTELEVQLQEKAEQLDRVRGQLTDLLASL